MLWDPAHPLLVVGVEMSFGGFIITRAALFLPSYMTEMTHTDTHKKKNSNCIFSLPHSRLQFILQEKYETEACEKGRLWQV